MVFSVIAASHFAMTGFFSTNLFDLAVYVCLFVAVVMGFMTGLLRSLATIFGYLCGMGVAVAAAPKLTPLLATYLKTVTPQTWVVFVAVFIAAGAIIGALLRLAVSEMVGPNVSIPDRIAGALLGAFRIVLLAVLLVLVFDRMIPPGREPAFLKGSQWRPVLSSAAQYGLQSLPPEIEDYIDRLKRQRRI
jgi:membrane protein required for colicin V production